LKKWQNKESPEMEKDGCGYMGPKTNWRIIAVTPDYDVVWGKPLMYMEPLEDDQQ
jgi:hypothetical protein